MVVWIYKYIYNIQNVCKQYINWESELSTTGSDLLWVAPSTRISPFGLDRLWRIAVHQSTRPADATKKRSFYYPNCC